MSVESGLVMRLDVQPPLTGTKRLVSRMEASSQRRALAHARGSLRTAWTARPICQSSIN